MNSNPLKKLSEQPLLLARLNARPSYQAGVLALFALLAGGLLGLADWSTREIIQLRLEEDLRANLEQVIPAGWYDNDPLTDHLNLPLAGHDQVTVYRARKQGRVMAVSFKWVAPDGYSGPITLVLGVARDGTVLGVRVLAHTETPGLGDKIELAKSSWILSFNGKSLANLAGSKWAVKKDGGIFDQFAGATITPRKTIKAIKHALEFFQQRRAQLIESATAATGE